VDSGDTVEFKGANAYMRFRHCLVFAPPFTENPDPVTTVIIWMESHCSQGTSFQSLYEALGVDFRTWLNQAYLSLAFKAASNTLKFSHYFCFHVLDHA
jgi:hypothetical protein